MKLFQNLILLSLLFLVVSCKEEYIPKVKSTEQSVLVVEGILNNGNGPTIIRLTRTYKLDDSAVLRPETGAQVSVEGNNGAAFYLFDGRGDGSYFSEQLPFDPAEQYRLHIMTYDGKEYVSDFVPVLKNPPIDSVSWKRTKNGVQLYVNTHNPENDTRYYRWEYDETWEIQSAYFSSWKVVNNQPVKRTPDEFVYECWRYYNSSNILLGSTTQLSSDVVFEMPLIFIPEESDKLSVRYSVLVRQYALDKQGYEFYQLLKKNTESLGSIFDAQPSESGGNVHSVSDPTETVIGYITATPVQEQRIFISKKDVTDWKFHLNCGIIVEVPNNPDSFPKYFGGDFLPFSAEPDFLPTKFYASHRECVDCTIRGGSTERPFFW